VDAETVRQHWPAILDAVVRQSRVAWLQLSNATVHSLEDGVLVIGFTREGEAKGFAARGSDQELTGALADVLGVKLRVRALAGVPAGSQPASSRPRVADSAPAGGAPAGSGPAGSAHAGGNPAAGGPGQAAQAGAASGTGGEGTGPARRGAGARRAPGSQSGPASRAPQPRRSAPPEDDWPDEPSGPEDSAPAPPALSGMDLIARQLGGQVIEEIDGE
jgi:DNA polymerase-3 subunit gamma/tau